MKQSKKKGKKRRRRPGLSKLLRCRGALWKQHPFCRSCRMPVVDVRQLRKTGVKIVSHKIERVEWIDQEGRHREELIATVHHIQSIEYHRLNGKKKPHRLSNLVLLRRPCHEKIEQAFGSGTAHHLPNKSLPNKPR